MKPDVYINSHLSAFMEKKNREKEEVKVAKLWRSLFLFTTITLFVVTAQAETYYISNSGSDSNSGTSMESPWETLEKVNNSGFSPGDQILFKRGDQWAGVISVTSSGTSANPIIYGAYGTGEKPKIYGSERITGWERFSGNIYKAACNHQVTQLFLNDTRLRAARYPNDKSFLVTNVNSSVQFTSSELSSAGANHYMGAKLIIKTNEWRLDTRDVTASSGQTLTVDSPTSYGLSNGQDFFLTNKLEFLDQSGEWYYEAATETLYLWTPNGDSPDNYEIRGSIYSNGVSVYQKNYITITDLDLLQHSDRGIKSEGYGNVFKNNSILFPETNGIQNKGDNCTISENLINGINHVSISHSGANGVISENEILNTALFENFGIRGMQGYSQVIASAGNNTTISYNRVINAGYNGITWTGQDCNLSYNYIENVCTYLYDGGAIYTYSTDINKLVSSGSVVSYNIAYNCHGTASLYMDNNTRDVILEYNTVVNDGTGGNYGIFFHDTKNVIARYNTIFNNKTGTRATHTFGGNVFTNNIVCNTADTNSDGDSPKLSVVNSDEETLSLDNNKYIDHHRKEAFMNTKTYTYLNFNEWQDATKGEGNSSIDNSALNPGEKEVLFFNDTRQVKTIDFGNIVYRDIDGNTVSGKLTLQPFKSIILIKTTSSIPDNNSPEIGGQSFYIEEKKNAGDFIGQVVASDPDNGQSLTYLILSGNDDNLFSLDQTTGKLTANSEINLLNDKNVVLTVEVTDDAQEPLSAQAAITIFISATDTADTDPPVISSFSVPESSNDLTVSILDFEASDNIAVTGYIITESSNLPSITDARWTATIPWSYTFSEYGEKTLYSWVKDDAGNLSGMAESTVFIKDMTPVYTTEDISVCEGDSYQGWTTTGQYERTLQSYTGADSIVTTNLYVNPGYSISEDITINEGESYLGWTISGKYERTLNTVFGCDSIIVTNLTVISLPDPVYTTEDIFVCEGESYQGWTSSGQYVRTLQTAEGSDSVVTTNLYVNPVYHITEDISINEGEAYLGWTLSGEYERTLASVSGCDSIVTTNLTVIEPIIDANIFLPEPVYTTEDISICEGESYQGWTTTGQYERTLQSYTGADSIVTTSLYVNPGYSISEDITISKGEAYLGWTVSGEYQRTLASVYGCDSIVITNLTVVEPEPVIPVFTQEIDLRKRWNIFSTYLVPEEKDMNSIVEDLTNSGDLVKVIDQYDRTFEQASDGTWINNIGDLSEAQGYKILLGSNCVLNLSGTKVSLPFEIHLNEGWNIISFPYSENASAMDVMQPLIDQNLLIKVQNEKGRSLEDWGRRFGWVNNIGDFIPGEGYLVKVNAACTLTIRDTYLKSTVLLPEEESLTYFNCDYSGYALEYMNIFVDLLQSDFQVGDEIAVYDGEICVGAHKISYYDMENNFINLVAPMSDEGESNGFVAGNQITLKGWKSSSEEEVIIESETLSGEMIYRKGGSVLAQVTNDLTEGIGDMVSLDIAMYPNPATSRFTLKFSVLLDKDIQVIITDTFGRQMASRMIQSDIETFDIRNYPSGVYLVNIGIGNKHQIKKLVKE